MGKAVDITVTGRVQGVAFRAYAEQEARRLGVAGWIRNEPDGTVAGHLEGEEDRVDQMVDWCRTGPPMARVRDVAVRQAAASGATSFELRY